ncbi:MAG: acyl-CoA dehydrogenase family protein [Nitrospinota bacterium]|nr:acyl-CoA dehydrogenase family protein [Nitrospinota bacterium]
MDFHLSEEQKGLQKLARDFARNELIPNCAELDRFPDGEDAFPWDLVERGSKLGFNNLAIPKEHGGHGASVLTQVLVIEELSAGEAAVSKVYSHNWKGISGILAAASEEQIARILPDYVKDPRYCIGIGLTEPNSGSDNSLPYDEKVSAGPMLSAVRDGDYYVLNGMKHYIALSAQCKYISILARTDKNVPWTEGVTGFMVFPPQDGLEIGRLHDKVGLRLYPQNEVIVNNMRIPVSDRLGEEGKFHTSRKTVVNIGTVEATATALGIAKRSYELALQYARERVQGGKPIIEHQIISCLLLEMFTRLEASRSMLWRSACSIDNGIDDDPKLARVTKAFTVEALNYITTKTVEIWGGMGVMTEAPVEKVYRDAIQLFHMGSTNQVNLMKAMPDL